MAKTQKKKKASPVLYHPALAAINAFKSVEGIESLSLTKASRVEGTISTGVYTADLILGGGFPSGRLVTIFGPEGCGKSTFLQEFIVSCQFNEITVIHYDYEGGSDPVYMANQGIDLDVSVKLPELTKDGKPKKRGKLVDVPNYHYAQPDFGEGTYRHILQTLKHLAPVEEGPPQIVFIIDSFAAMASEEIDDETGDARIAPNARMHSHFLQMIKPRLRRKGALIVGANQMRVAVGSWGPRGSPEVEVGGGAIKYYPDQKLMITRKKLVQDNTNLDVLPVNVRTPKNKVFIPLRVAEGLGIVLGRGFDRALDAQIFLEKTGHLKLGGKGLRKIVYPKRETKFLSWADFRKLTESPRFQAFLARQLKRNKTFRDYLATDGPANYSYDQDLQDYEGEDVISEEEIERRVTDEAEEYREHRKRRRKRGKRGRGRGRKQTRDDEALEEEG